MFVCVPSVPECSTGEVILESPVVKKKKIINACIRWCFTLNNYEAQEFEEFCAVITKTCKYGIIGKEVADSGTPHLQGYLEFLTKKRPMSVFKSNKIHWEKAGGNRAASTAYCSKENCVFEHGGVAPLKLITDLRPYQEEVLKLIKEEPDDRTIIWYWGKVCLGKTQLLKLLCAKHGCYVLPASKKHALSQVYMTHETVDFYCVNLTADESAYQKNCLFSIIEAVKDGMFSAAFGTTCNGMCLFNSKHMLVLANAPPDFSKTEIDRARFIIRYIDENFVAQENVPCKKWVALEHEYVQLDNMDDLDIGSEHSSESDYDD